MEDIIYEKYFDDELDDMAFDHVAEELAFFASIDEAMREEEEELKADMAFEGFE